MEGKTTIQIPADVTNAISLKRFLLELVNYVDKATGLKGNAKVSTEPWVASELASYATQSYVSNVLLGYATEAWITTELSQYVTSASLSTALGSYATEDWVNVQLSNYVTNDLLATTLSAYATQSWVTANFTYNPEQATITSLAQTISATYVQSEVQAISSKVDAILVALRSANIITP